jgi:predicted DNA-binding protein (MmcQ/YjbR family)
MPADALQQQARERASELPGAELGFPFGPEWEVFKVRGKVFLLMTATTGEPIVTLKAAPEDGVALRQQYEGITAGYHMNKRHWLTLRPDADLSDQLVDDLVTESYLLVVAGLPRARRPVDPVTFGRDGR